MAESFIQLPADSTGKLLRTEQLVVGVNTTQQEVVTLGDPTTSANLAGVTAGGALKVDGSAVTQPVSGTVTANAGTGTFTVSGTVTSNAGTNLNTSLLATDAHLTNPQVAGGGTTAPATIVTIGGKTNDATPQYDILPEGPGGRSVIVEGIVSGVAVPVSGTFFQATQPVSGTVTANQGTANTKANAWTTELTDGTNGPAAVKAASIAAVAADPALVVAVSPNNSVAVTGTFFQATQPVSGTVTANAGTGTFNIQANASVNLAQVAGATVNTGNGTAAGSPRVAIASDNTAFSVNAAQSGNWTARVVGNAGAIFDAAQNAVAPANEVVVGGTYNTTIPALTAGNSSQIQVDSTGSSYVNIEGRKATYSCFASFTPVAGDIAVLPGSASKTIRVTRVEVSLSTTGTAALEAVQLIKRSTADSAGTSAAMTAVAHDSNFAAASAAPLSYTAAPTLGTAVGTLRGVQFFDESATVAGANTWLWTFGERPASAVVLRGIAQELCVNLGGVVATQTATVSFEWTEE